MLKAFTKKKLLSTLLGQQHCAHDEAIATKITHKKKRKKFAFFFFSRLSTSKAHRQSWVDTERKHRRTSNQSLTHTHTHAPSSLIVVFAAARAEEAENAKRNAFKRNFRVSVLCCLRNCSVAIFSTRIAFQRKARQPTRKEEKKIGKKFYTISHLLIGLLKLKGNFSLLSVQEIRKKFKIKVLTEKKK